MMKKKQLFFKRQLNLFSFRLSLLLCIKLSIQEIIRSRWSWDKKQASERNQEWEKGRKERSIREPKSCISRQTVEMNRRCLSTEDEPPPTAGWGSDLCQCVYDLLQRYNVLETRQKWHVGRGKSFKQRKGFASASRLGEANGLTRNPVFVVLTSYPCLCQELIVKLLIVVAY